MESHSHDVSEDTARGHIRDTYTPYHEEIARRRAFVESGGLGQSGFSHLKQKSGRNEIGRMHDPDQRFVVFNMSHTSIAPRSHGDDPGIRICGTFATQQEAQNHAVRVSIVEPECSVLISPTQQWTVMASSPELLSDNDWCDTQRSKLLKQHYDEVERRVVKFDQRRGKPQADTKIEGELIWTCTVSKAAHVLYAKAVRPTVSVFRVSLLGV